jgi:hypothetical protein
MSPLFFAMKAVLIDVGVEALAVRLKLNTTRAILKNKFIIIPNMALK